MHRSFKTILLTLLAGGLLPACSEDQQPEPEAETQRTYRIATFNIAMGLPEMGAMRSALESGEDPRLIALAAVLQTVRPDVVLLNEFDFDPAIDAAYLLNRNYLERPQLENEPISYAHSFQPAVNTGVDSGLDLDGDSVLAEPEDAWGYGVFPGQYGMLILSRQPILEREVRSFQRLPWANLPDPRIPVKEDGAPYYPDSVWSQLRLSSKNHVDVPILLDGHRIHLFASHPTPPVFDGPEDRNGKRNHDELAFWVHYITDPDAGWIRDDQGTAGGFASGDPFIIAGDLNADPSDGDAVPGAIAQLLDHPAIDPGCVPTSTGGAEAAELQGGVNPSHHGDPAADTSDFSDDTVGNYRLDYVLPSRGLGIEGCGVLWPDSGSDFHTTATFSDHRLVWIDIAL